MTGRGWLAAALVLVVAGCTPGAKAPPRDPGKVVPATKRVSVPGRLYAVKSRTLYRFSGTHVTALTKDVRVLDPAVTLDGAELAYAQLTADGSTIMISSSEAFNPRAVSAGAGPEGPLWAFAPAFAPDGRSLAFLTDRGKRASGPPDLAVWRYDIVRQRTDRLTFAAQYTGGDSDPTFRPGADGQLLYTSYSYEGDPPLPAARLTWISLAPRRTVFISPPGDRTFQPAFSPDGRYLAFIRAGAGSDDLFVMPVPVTFTQDQQPYPTESATLLQPGVVAQPVWAPDGSALAFLMLAEGSFDLFMLPITMDGGVRATGGPVPLTHGSFFDADSRLAWSP